MTYENIYTPWSGESTVLQYLYIELLYMATFKNVEYLVLREIGHTLVETLIRDGFMQLKG